MLRALAVAVLVTATAAGCGLTVPTDPEGTLDAVRGGILRVGVSDEPGLIETDGDAATGPLAELVEEFAARLDADVDWTSGSEESLVVALEDGDLDLVAGGMTTDTPWSDRVAVTRGHLGIPGAGGRSVVFFAVLGENAFVSELETFLDEELPR